MKQGFKIVAIASLVYYGVLVLSSGFSFSFALIWPVISMVSIGLLFIREYYILYKDKIPLWVPVSVVTCLSVAIGILCLLQVFIFYSSMEPSKPNLDYVIVLGARVKEDEISNTLKRRLDKAIEYANENLETIFILSGGQGMDEPVSEAIAMRDYLLMNGIDAKRMLLETRSTSTAENMEYSQLVLNAHKGKYKQDKEMVSIGVLTSNYHLFRAKGIGKNLGMSNLYGIGASSDPILWLHSSLRESIAILKDQFMGNM